MTEKGNPSIGEGSRDAQPEVREARGTAATAQFDVLQYMRQFRDLPTANADTAPTRGTVTADGSLQFNAKFDQKGNPEQQLQQFADMHKKGTADRNGNVHAQIEVNGQVQDVTISREKMGNAHLMDVRDSQGRLMMRALERDGHWQPQRAGHGGEVSYFGKAYQDGTPSDAARPDQQRRDSHRREREPDQTPTSGNDSEATPRRSPHRSSSGRRDGDNTGRVPGEPSDKVTPAVNPSNERVMHELRGVKLTPYFSGRGAGTGEGGPKDEVGNKLYSVEEFLKDPSKPVSVAVDRRHVPGGYAQHLSIPELDRKYASELNQLVAEGKLSEPKFRFAAVDNGPAVRGHHIDICLARYKSERFPNNDIAHGANVRVLDQRGRNEWRV